MTDAADPSNLDDELADPADPLAVVRTADVAEEDPAIVEALAEDDPDLAPG
jgi:hypothetical protein